MGVLDTETLDKIVIFGVNYSFNVLYPREDIFSLFFCFTADMFAHEDGGPEPDWVRIERDQFSDFRDLNKDGKMDLEEIRHWILPQDYDHAQAEARHLVYESDTDKVRTY